MVLQYRGMSAISSIELNDVDENEWIPEMKGGKIDDNQWTLMVDRGDCLGFDAGT